MATTIESLELNITSNSTSAASGITALTNSLKKLKQVTSGGLGLSAVANQLNLVKNAANGITSGTISKLTGLANAISLFKTLSIPSAITTQLTALSTALSGLASLSGMATSLSSLASALTLFSGVTISASIANQLTAIVNALSGIPPGAFSTEITDLVTALAPLSSLATPNLSAYITQLNRIPALVTAIGGVNMTAFATQISALATALAPLSTMAKGGLSSIVNALQKIPNVFATLNTINMSAFTQKIKDLAKALAPLATQMQKIANGFAAFPNKIKKVTSSMGSLSLANNKGAASFLMLGGKITIAYRAIKKVVSVIGTLVKKTSDYIENVNLFTVSMGSYADEAKAYAETVSEIMGIDPGEWMRHQGIFQTLATGFGVANDKAAIMSKNLTQLGYDISSFYNLDTGDAMEKLQSGLAGELEPLRRIGYDLSQAKLQATALELGIDKSVSSMTQAEKAMLRYYAIMTQVTTVQGDMARTLEAPANQMRIFKAQLEMLLRSLGSIFIPLLNKVMPYLIAVTKVLREMVSTIAGLVGFEMPEVDYTGVESLASGAEDTSDALDGATESAKKLKSYMMGFDELNVISQDDGSSSSGDNSVGAFDIELPEYDFLGEATNSRVEGIITKIKEVLAPLGELIDKTVEWAKALDLEPISKGFERLGSSIGPALSTIGDLFNFVYEEVLMPITEWAIENGLPVAFEAIAKAIDVVVKVVRPLLDGIKELKPVLEPIVSWVGDVVITVFEGLGSIFDKVAGVFEEKGDIIKGIITGLGDVVVALWTFLRPIIENVQPQMSILGDLISGVIGGIIDAVAGIVDFVAGVLTGDWERAWDGIKNIFSGVWDVIVSIVKFAWKSIKEFLTPIAKWFDKNIIQPIVGFFKGLWGAVSGFFASLWEDIVGVWNVVATWFDENVIQPIVNFFAPIVETISTFFEGCWLIIQAVWVVVSKWFNEKVIQPVVGFFKGLWESVSGFFSDLWEDIKGIWKTVSNWFDTKVIQPVVGFFKGVWTSVSGFFSDLWKDIKGVWKSVSTWFNDTIIEPVKKAFETACDAIGKFFSNLWLGIRQGVANAMNFVISGIEGAINWIIGGINKLVGGFDKIVQWAADVLGKDWGGINLIQEVSFKRIEVPTYAQGGFPDSGQAFIARENGIPEMVGSIGRRTAVANNEQIVESVASGVAEANGEQNALLREQNALLRALLEKDNGVYLDGRSLSNSVDKYKREQGRVLIAGGAL